jgi:hypothetical protein
VRAPPQHAAETALAVLPPRHIGWLKRAAPDRRPDVVKYPPDLVRQLYETSSVGVTAPLVVRLPLAR